MRTVEATIKVTISDPLEYVSNLGCGGCRIAGGYDLHPIVVLGRDGASAMFGSCREAYVYARSISGATLHNIVCQESYIELNAQGPPKWGDSDGPG